MPKNKRKRTQQRSTKPPSTAAPLPPIIDREMVSGYVNFGTEAILGLIVGLVFVFTLSSFGGFLDWMVESKILHRGPIYDVLKWTVDVVGTATGTLSFLAFQWRLIKKIYADFRKR